MFVKVVKKAMHIISLKESFYEKINNQSSEIKESSELSLSKSAQIY